MNRTQPFPQDFQQAIQAAVLQAVQAAIAANFPLKHQVGPQLLTISEAARLWGMSKSTFLGIVENFEIPFVNLGTWRRFDVDDLGKFLADHKTTPRKLAIEATAGTVPGQKRKREKDVSSSDILRIRAEVEADIENKRKKKGGTENE